MPLHKAEFIFQEMLAGRQFSQPTHAVFGIWWPYSIWYEVNLGTGNCENVCLFENGN